MNSIQWLRNKVRERFPGLTVVFDPPAREEGIWYLDIFVPGRVIIVQYQPPDKFGLSVSPDGDPEEAYKFTHKPDLVFDNETDWRNAVFTEMGK